MVQVTSTPEQTGIVIHCWHKLAGIDYYTFLAQVTSALEQTLEQQADKDVREAQRWLAQMHEKLAWCADTAGDKYSLEAKQAALREMMGGLGGGEEKCALAIQQLDDLIKVAPESKRAELLQQRAALVKALEAIRAKTGEARSV